MTRRLRPWHVVVPAAVVLVALDLLSAFLSRSSDHPVAWAFVTSFAGIAFAAAGLIAWRRRPDNGTGRLLVLSGLAWLAFAPLWTANDSVLYTAGNAFGDIPIALLLLLVALYPEGRPTSRLERLLATTVFPLAILSGLLPTLFEGSFSFGCKSCPGNAFLVSDEPRVYDALQAVFGVVGIVFFLGVVLLAVRRWRAATPALRRVLKPVYLTGGVAVAAIGVGFGVGFASDTASGALWLLALAGVALLPFALLAGLLQTSLMLGVRALLDHADEPGSEEAQDAIRRALGDPTARLGLWIEQSRTYVDVRGDPFPRLVDGVGRAYSPIESEAGPLGFIEHDATVDVHAPELLARVVTACRIALEKDSGRQALERSEVRMRALLDAMPDLMIRFTRDGTYLDIRGDVRGLVRPREEMLGRNVREFLPPDVVERVMGCAAAALSTRSIQSLEYELDVEGEGRIFEARMVPGTGDEIVSIVRDITLSRRLEREVGERLREVQHEQTFTRTVVNTAPIVLMLCDDKGGIIRYNATTERLTHRPDDERVWGRAFWEVFVHPEDATKVQAAFAKVGADQPPAEIECRWLTREGDELFVECTINHIVDGQGLPRRIVAALDVTEREQGRQELVRQRDLLGVVARATPNILFVAEQDGKIAWEGVNPAFEEVTGHDDATACGREFWELVVAPEHVEAVRAEFAAAVATSGVRVFSAELVTKDGERRLIDWSSRPLTGLDNQTKQLLCGVDVTERERHLREIRASRARLVEAQDAERRRLERNLHDGAQQRLVSLSLALRLAQAKLASDPEGAGDILAAAGDELTLALAELRELARGIHPAMLTDRGLGTAVESLATRAPVPVELAAMPAERLPAPVEAAAFYVISEALANIGKYAQASLATISVSRVDGRAVVEVADDGVGGADPGRGSGLRGLVDRVEALDGTLEVESPAGGGTRIVAEIPCGP